MSNKVNNCSVSKYGSVACVLIATLPTLAIAETGRIIAGEPTITDGDSLRVNNEPIRLWGIDAFESNQMCGAMDCGQIATARLNRIIQNASINAAGSHTVFCVEKDKDNHGRTVAICRINGIDLSAALVLQGFAVAYRQYSVDYVAEEDFAKLNRVGAWAFTFENPWDFRRGSTANSNNAGNGGPQPAASQNTNPPAPIYAAPRAPASADCNIKGNINSRGDRIYHTTSSPNYSRTVPERMFCSEAEAIAAGFRAPRR